MNDIPAHNLRTRLSHANERRKRAARNRRLKRHFLHASLVNDAPSPEDICNALAMLEPLEIDAPLIRVGPDKDGGYVLPDDLTDISALFSPGVSREIGFDHAMADRGVECFLADASIDVPPNLRPNMHFISKFVGTSDDRQLITMQSWIDRSEVVGSELMLQMDIEGAEYDVLHTVSPEILARFRLIILEIHDLQRLAERAWLNRFSAVISKLNSGHVLCHLHTNNAGGFFEFDGRIVPEVIELSYIRADRVRPTGVTAKIPHPLDIPNTRKLIDIPNSCFWRSPA